MELSPESLLEQLQEVSSCNGFVVAYSGGLDSSVLLHVMHRVRSLTAASNPDAPPVSLRAIHINHGLSVHANHWQRHCERTCAQLGISLSVERVTIDLTSGSSLENLARQQRYAAFERLLEAGECLVMAHHLDDTAETFLLRSLRGAGPRGLAAIPRQRPLGLATLMRPLLGHTRAQLMDYAEKAQLDWCDDESNENRQFDRNYCRHEVLPAIEARWPAFRESWKRSALLCAEADILLDDLAALDYEGVKTPVVSVIDAVNLCTLQPHRQRNLLRYWLSRAGAPEPGWHVLTQIVEELLPASAGAQAEIRWRGGAVTVVLRRFRRNLYLKQEMLPLSDARPISWCVRDPVHLPRNGLLYGIATGGGGLRVSEQTPLTLRYRQGGERCRLHARRMRLLKKILQDAAIEPWLRDRIPLVYSGDTLVCIPGIGICEGWQAGAEEAGWNIVWVPPDASPVS